MAKTCNDIECNYPQFGGGYCKFHQFMRLDKKIKYLKRSHFKAKRPRKGISTFSAKEVARLAKYRPIRDKFLHDNPTCMINGCNGKSTLHHAKGRVGDLLFDVQYFRNLCWKHHEYYERNPEEAKELGISIDRLAK